MGVSPQERAALIALYESAGGATWDKRDGWLGPPGTECDWAGVFCDYSDTQGSVIGLHLVANGLAGTLPNELDYLVNLNELLLFGNTLRGPVPPGLLKKFDSGRLRFLGYATQFSDVRLILLEVTPTGVICGDYSATLRADGSATLEQKVCRSSTPGDRGIFWETRKGFIDRYAGDFDRLARLSETLGLSELAGEYDRSITHSTFETITIETTTGRSIVIRDYADAASAQVWLMKRAIAGALFNAEWEDVQRSDVSEE